MLFRPSVSDWHAACCTLHNTNSIRQMGKEKMIGDIIGDEG